MVAPPPPPPPPGTLDFLFNSMELGKQVWNEVKVKLFVHACHRSLLLAP